jgi:hypothetical protein
MKLEEGMYVRTKYGIKKVVNVICGQDVKFDDTNGFDDDLYRYHEYDGIAYNGSYWKDIVIGEPKFNIISLIEVGDYVNGYKVIYQADCYSYFNIDTCDWIYIKENKDIKSIVTKEQFESMKYEVE